MSAAAAACALVVPVLPVRNIQKDLHVPGSLQHRDMQVLISAYITSSRARISGIRSAGGRHCNRNRQLGSCSIQLIASNSDGADSCPPYTSTRGLSLRPSEKSPRPETARKAASRQRGVCQRLSGTICPQPREQHANDADALQCIASAQAQRSAACIPLRSRSVAADASCNARNAARNAGRPATCLADVD